MLRGPLHDKGADGRCTECREPFPCPEGLAIYDLVVDQFAFDPAILRIYDAVKRELERPKSDDH